MDISNYISVNRLCNEYSLDVYFFEYLYNQGIIQLVVWENLEYIELEVLDKVEKLIRIHQDLEVPVNSLDVVINLLEKIETLQKEVNTIRNNSEL